MTKHVPWPVQKSEAVGTSAADLRANLAGLLSLNSPDPFDVREGIFRDSDDAIVAGTAGLTVNVRPFVAVFAGPLLASSDAVESVALAAVPSTNSRWDVIYAVADRVSGDGVPTAADPGLRIEKVTGTPGSVPATPAVPTGAIPLARVRVYFNTTATSATTIEALHPWTVARGAPIPVRSLAERNAITPVLGSRVLRLDNGGNIQRYDAAEIWVDDGSGPIASVARNAAGTLPGPGLLTINMDTVDFDPAGMWSASNPERLTAKVAGVYRIHATGGWTGGSTIVAAEIRVNGSTVRLNPVSGNSQEIASVEILVRLDVGDYVSMGLISERAAGNTTNTSSDRKPRMTAQMIAP